MKEVRAFWEKITRGEEVDQEETLAAFARLLAVNGDLETEITRLKEKPKRKRKKTKKKGKKGA